MISRIVSTVSKEKQQTIVWKIVLSSMLIYTSGVPRMEHFRLLRGDARTVRSAIRFDHTYQSNGTQR